MDSMVPFRSVIVKLDDLHDVTVKDDIVYTGKFPLGVLWFMNKDYVEVQNASFIKITNPSPAATFNPDWTSKPGDTIVDCLKEREMSLTEFAKQMSISIVYIGRLIDGSTPINPDIAERLSKVLGSTSEFWIEREKQYRQQVKHESGN
jgi:addiction module HigA family antidote